MCRAVAEPRSYTVTRTDVEALLRLGKVEPGALAIPPSNGGPSAEVPEAVLRGLEREGWLEPGDAPRLRPECRAALATVAAPLAVLRLALGSPSGIRVLNLRGPAFDGSWVRMDLEDVAWGRFEFPLDENCLVERAADALDLGAELAVPGLSVRWSWDRYRVLLGLTDVTRTACLEAIMARSHPAAVTFTADAVAEAWRQAVERPHPFWAASLAEVIAPGTLPPERGRIRGVLQELAADGYLSGQGGGAFQARLAVQEFAMSLLFVPAFLALSQVTPEGPRPRLAGLRGAGALWRLEFFRAGEDTEVEIMACGEEAFTRRFREVLREAAGAPVLATRRMSAAEADTVCGGCGRPLRAAARFCPGCGRGVGSAPAPACLRCGHQPNRSSRFCPRCSAPLAV